MDTNIGTGNGTSGIEDEILSFAGTGSDTGDNGNGSRGVGGDTPKRRGRPRKQTIEGDSEGINVLSATSDTPARTKTRSKKTGLSSSDIAANIALACNMIAGFRGPHWVKTANDCLPLAEPLKEGIERLPQEIRDTASNIALPIAIIAGAIIVLGKPIQTEIEIIKNGKPIRSNVRSNANTGSVGTPVGQYTPNPVSNGVAKGDGYSGVGLPISPS